jgi:predicted transport protein
MDQGQTYLNLILDHKAEVLLEYNERKNKNLKRKDISWEHTKVIFIAPNFTPYQKRALHPKLPFELWEVKRYEDNLIIYNQIQPLILERTGKSAPSLIGRAGKEIKINTVEDIINKCSPFQKEAIRAIEEVVFELGSDIKEVAGKSSITFRTAKPFLQILMFGKERNAINVYFNKGYKLKDNKKLLGGRGRFGRSIRIYSLDQISEVKDYIKQAYKNSLKLKNNYE